MLKELKAAILIILVVLLTIATAHAQRKFAGKVVDVVDGRTCVLELPAGRITAVLQYIETPDADQPLHDVVAAHLRSLVIGKSVEFSPRIVMTDRTVGQMLLGGVDVGQQLLRDGAAWHSLPEKSGQDANERARYEQNEALAKTEKRGVWSIEQLKPTWEYRAEQEALAAKAEKDAIEKARIEATWKMQNRPVVRAKPIDTSNIGQTNMWSNFFDENQLDQPLGIGGLRTRSFPEFNLTYIRTPGFSLPLAGAGLESPATLVGFYAYIGNQYSPERQIFCLVVATRAKAPKYGAVKSLGVTIDGRKMTLPRVYRSATPANGLIVESQVFPVTAAQLEKLAKARTYSFELGGRSGNPTEEIQSFIQNLVNVTPN